MPVTISLINMKGGVGKTTLTVALAEFMSLEHGLKVLVIDLDPQANATACLMDLNQWKRQNMRGQTIMRLFLDTFQEWQVFSPADTLVRTASNIGGGVDGLHLLPSGQELMDLQDSLLTIYSDRKDGASPAFILRNAINEILAEYDIVLIDCPPSLGLITQNGLAISDYYLIPVIPEALSLHGIPQIISRVNRMKRQKATQLETLGLVVNKYRAQNPEHSFQVEALRAGGHNKGYQRVFDTVIAETAAAANAMDYNKKPKTLRAKYSSPQLYNQYRQLTQEVLQYVGKPVHNRNGRFSTATGPGN